MVFNPTVRRLRTGPTRDGRSPARRHPGWSFRRARSVRASTRSCARPTGRTSSSLHALIGRFRLPSCLPEPPTAREGRGPTSRGVSGKGRPHAAPPFGPAARAAGHSKPCWGYDLRHSFSRSCSPSGRPWSRLRAKLDIQSSPSLATVSCRLSRTREACRSFRTRTGRGQGPGTRCLPVPRARVARPIGGWLDRGLRNSRPPRLAPRFAAAQG